MGALALLIVFGSAILVPSLLVARFSPHGIYSRRAFFMLSPIVAIIGGTSAYFVFPLLVLAPSSPKEHESFLVNQVAIGFLAACILPWLVYFVLKIYQGKHQGVS